MKALRRILALLGFAMGAVVLVWAAEFWSFISRGPFPSGIIHTEGGELPFFWTGGMTWKEYGFVATLAIVGIGLIAVSYRFGFRRHTAVASPNSGPTKPPTTSGVEERPPSVS